MNWVDSELERKLPTSILGELVKTALQTLETALNHAEESFAQSVGLALGLLLDVLHYGADELHNGDEQGSKSDRAEMVADGAFDRTPDGRTRQLAGLRASGLLLLSNAVSYCLPSTRKQTSYSVLSIRCEVPVCDTAGNDHVAKVDEELNVP